jgi:transcriptional antiterminator Rof (Rho-off)
MIEEKQHIVSNEIARLKAELASKAQEQEAVTVCLMKKLTDADASIVTLSSINVANEDVIASMTEEMAALHTRVADLESMKLELENEILIIENEKHALERKLHLEDTVVSSIFEVQEANINDDESSLYQGIDCTLMDSMNISCDAHQPTTLGSPRGLEYVRVAEETTKYLLNELDDLKRTKETLEKSIRDIRIKLTPKKTPIKRMSLSPHHKACSPKAMTMSPKIVSLGMKKGVTNMTPNSKSPKRVALSPLPLTTTHNNADNVTHKRVVKRKTISIDVDAEDNENINPYNNTINSTTNNAMKSINNTITTNSISKPTNIIHDDDIDNNISSISITKIKPSKGYSQLKKTAMRTAARLKIGKINISTLLEG